MQSRTESIVSEEDLALIHALQVNPRVSWTDAARILDSHPTTLAARWERLRAAGLAWVTGHGLGVAGQSCLAFVDVECDLSRRAEVIRAVCAIPEVISVDISARNRDLLLTVLTPTIGDLSDRVLSALTDIPGMLRYRSSLCTGLHVSGDAWRLTALSRAQVHALRQLAPERDLDAAPVRPPWPIAAALARDGRASAADIARETGMHPATVRRHLNRILETGALTFRCDVAQEITGLPLTCQWFVTVPAGGHEAAAHALRDLPNLRLCASTTGTTNLLIVSWLGSVGEVLPVEHRIVERAPSTQIVESSIALNIVKRLGWLLDDRGRATGEVVPPRAWD